MTKRKLDQTRRVRGVRFTDSEWERLESEAIKRDMYTSAYIRDIVLSVVKKIGIK